MTTLVSVPPSLPPMMMMLAFKTEDIENIEGLMNLNDINKFVVGVCSQIYR
jgi:hypothetical protein